MTPGPSLLVVEDDPDIALMVGMALEMAGYEVRTAHNGAEALALLADYDPALILLDMRMPVMDGWRFSGELRKSGRTMPILVMTAAESAPTHAAEIGTPHWIAKPFDIDALLDLVGEIAGAPTG